MDTVVLFIKDHWGDILALCGVFGIGLEITPVKFKPISKLLQKAGLIMNSEIIKKVDNIERELYDFKKESDSEKINNIRKEIVDFSLSCQRDEHHTRDEFDRVLGRVDEYHDLLKKYKKENGKIDIEVRFINKIYQECLFEHKFFEG